jgi:hypothetical protein
MVVTGRVLYGERVRNALLRHLEKDLGPVALPRIPPEVAPFTVVEYFPNPEVSGFHDPRHHAVSLAFVVPVDGEDLLGRLDRANRELLDLDWRLHELVVAPVPEIHRPEPAGGQARP